MTVSVLVPSYRRPDQLLNCLHGLAAQSRAPLEVIVVWQGDDEATRTAAEEFAAAAPFDVKIIHSAEAGVVPSENAALAVARGTLIAMIDDDAVAPADWLERLTAYFNDRGVGMAGGPIDNFHSDGRPFERRPKHPIATVKWYGKVFGNGYDLPLEWRGREPRAVDHLAGSNMIFRRELISSFETGLRKYWQHFELEASFQVRRRGFTIMYDFGCVVDHFPTSTVYRQGRDGDLTVSVYNAAYNIAFVLAKHSPWHLRPVRLCHRLAVGNTQVPGLLGSLSAWRQYGNLRRELRVLWNCWANTLAGWRSGRRAARAHEDHQKR